MFDRSNQPTIQGPAPPQPPRQPPGSFGSGINQGVGFGVGCCLLFPILVLLVGGYLAKSCQEEFSRQYPEQPRAPTPLRQPQGRETYPVRPTAP